jgi:hypothetical protein
MKSIYPKEYKYLKELVGKIDEDDLAAIPLDGVLNGINLSPLSSVCFSLKT